MSHWGALSGSDNSNNTNINTKMQIEEEDRVIVLGNATNLCSWPIEGDPRRGRYLREGVRGAAKYEGGYWGGGGGDKHHVGGVC